MKISVPNVGFALSAYGVRIQGGGRPATLIGINNWTMKIMGVATLSGPQNIGGPQSIGFYIFHSEKNYNLC